MYISHIHIYSACRLLTFYLTSYLMYIVTYHETIYVAKLLMFFTTCIFVHLTRLNFFMAYSLSFYILISYIFWNSFWHFIWHSNWHTFWLLSGVSAGILILCDSLSGIICGNWSGIFSDIPTLYLACCLGQASPRGLASSRYCLGPACPRAHVKHPLKWLFKQG